MTKEQIFHLGVKAMIRNPDGDILILKRKGSNAWDFPGGRVQQNEDIIETLIREVKEETGISSLENIKPYGIFLTPIRIPLGESQSARLIFYCHNCSIINEQSIILSSEHDDFLWVPWEKAKTLLSLDFTKILFQGEINFQKNTEREFCENNNTL